MAQSSCGMGAQAVHAPTRRVTMTIGIGAALLRTPATPPDMRVCTGRERRKDASDSHRSSRLNKPSAASEQQAMEMNFPETRAKIVMCTSVLVLGGWNACDWQIRSVSITGPSRQFFNKWLPPIKPRTYMDSLPDGSV